MGASITATPAAEARTPNRALFCELRMGFLDASCSEPSASSVPLPQVGVRSEARTTAADPCHCLGELNSAVLSLAAACPNPRLTKRYAPTAYPKMARTRSCARALESHRGDHALLSGRPPLFILARSSQEPRDWRLRPFNRTVSVPLNDDATRRGLTRAACRFAPVRTPMPGDP